MSANKTIIVLSNEKDIDEGMTLNYDNITQYVCELQA